MQRRGLCQIPQRVAAGVAVSSRIRHLADAHAIEHNPHHAPIAHLLIAHLVDPLVSASAASIRSVNWSLNRSGTNPFMRLETCPCLFKTIVVGICDTPSTLVSPSSKNTR